MKEENFGKGGIATPKIKGIKSLTEIAGDSAPFDWVTGFDITTHIGEIPSKNQFSSFSCGGQASAYLDYVISKFDGREITERSARFIYAPVAVKGGGSSEQALMNRLTTVGSASESLVTSYNNGTTDETFMTTVSDFDAVDIEDAGKYKTLEPVYVDLDMESIAKAIKDNGAIILGIYGINNGTWLSKFPVPPKDSDTGLWAHWILAGKALTINGKKYIGLKNSWGDVGENGWQYIGEEYIPFLFTAWGFAKTQEIQSNIIPNFQFNKDLYFGMTDPDVNQLQERLKKLGYFPNINTTNFFGSITKQAVINYQKANNIFPQRGYCGIKTRTRLNKTAGETAINMTNIQFRWDKFLTIAGSALLMYLAVNLGNIEWTKAGIMSASIAAVQFIIQAIVKYYSK